MNRTRLLTGAVLALTLCFASAQSADAALVLALDLGANGIGAGDKVVVDDSGAATATQNVGASTNPDANPVAGAVTLITSIGPFVVTVSTALSKPVLGGTASMDLNVVVTSTGAGTLLIGTTDTGFPVPNGSGIASVVGGTIAVVGGGTVTVWGELDWVDQAGGVVSGNKEFSAAFLPDANEPDAQTVQVFSTPGAPLAFSGVAVAGGLPTATFSMTNYIRIVHNGAGTTSLDHFIHMAPEPASFLAFAPVLGLLALRRRNRKS